MPISPNEVHAIWEEVKRNHKRLDECPGPHEFGPMLAKPGAKYTCSKCGGVVDAVARSWYEKGLTHGRTP